MDFDPIAFGIRLKKLRKQKGITQEALGNKLNISNKLVSDIECGRRGLELHELAVLAEFFHVTTDYLMFGCTISQSDIAYIQDSLKSAANQLTAAQKYLEDHR